MSQFFGKNNVYFFSKKIQLMEQIIDESAIEQRVNLRKKKCQIPQKYNYYSILQNKKMNSHYSIYVNRDMSLMRTSILFAMVVLLMNYDYPVSSFQPILAFPKKDFFVLNMADTTAPSSVKRNTSGKGFSQVKIIPSSPQKIVNDLESKPASEIKEKLVDLLLHMTGEEDEFRLVENYVNVLEEKYIAPQTLDFFNMAIGGDWQFLFTTSVNNRPSAKLRLSELVQKFEISEDSPLEGKMKTKANWALAEDGTQSFDSYGLFTIECLYKINQGSRMILDLNQHLLEPAKGSKIPKDVEELVGLLHRSIPKEMFDPDGLAIDTTYADPDVRIVRFTGKRHESVRNIFFRSGSMTFNPSEKK